MVDVDLLEQLVSSMNEALSRLENAHLSQDINYINRLRVFIFDVQRQVDSLLNGGSGVSTGK